MKLTRENQGKAKWPQMDTDSDLEAVVAGDERVEMGNRERRSGWRLTVFWKFKEPVNPALQQFVTVAVPIM